MENNYNIVLLFLFGGLGMGLAGIILATIIRPHRPNDEKRATYECGPDTVGSSWVKYNFRFYTYILVFLLFDIEAVYLIPWSQYFGHLEKPSATALFLLAEMAIFLGILIIGLIYAWRKGGLNWVQGYEESPRRTGT